MNDPKREILRHIIATVAYRAKKPLTDAPVGFGEFKIGDKTKSPVEILSHMCDLFEWSLSQAKGTEFSRGSNLLTWDQEIERFYRALSDFDEFIAGKESLHAPLENLIQGPVADSLTHVGQIAMMRRLANSPIRGENFFKADIRIGRVSKEQSPPTLEFD
ncbi:MAG: hypothetical protein HKN25_16385 [Pyrinomonadaceae bacterium]|nr:hypothetical protein [Pyrinomonadaceae bacterium]